jgi:hypothetical protein
MRRLSILFLAILSACAPRAPVARPPTATAELQQTCGADIAARLQFIEDRLEERRGYARNYWLGWLGFETLSLAGSGVGAGLHEGSDRASDIADAIKTVIGIAYLVLEPPRAKRGADPLANISPDSPEACLRKLARAEQLLLGNARHERWRRSLIHHVGNVVFNLGVAAIVAETFDDRTDAWISGGIGTAVGEVQLFTFPWQANPDWEEYQRRFPPGTARLQETR